MRIQVHGRLYIHKLRIITLKCAEKLFGNVQQFYYVLLLDVIRVGDMFSIRMTKGRLGSREEMYVLSWKNVELRSGSFPSNTSRYRLSLVENKEDD